MKNEIVEHVRYNVLIKNIQIGFKRMNLYYSHLFSRYLRDF